MGKRAVAVVLLCLVFSTRAYAADVTELYEKYDMEYTAEVPEEVLETIQKYDNAKRYVSMYSYVINSEYDIESLVNKQLELEKYLLQLESELEAGYNKPLSDIYSLEDEYYTTKHQLDNISKSLQTYVIETESIETKDVPSYSKYKEALQSKNDIVSKRNIGSLDDLKVPVQSESILVDSSNDCSVYKVINNTGALSPFNGVVESIIVDEEYGLCCILNHHNGVQSFLCHLESVDVEEGDTVYQNQRIGYVQGNQFIFRLKLKDVFVDASKIFTEEFS